MIWQDDTWKDQLDGYVLALGVYDDLLADDPSLPAEDLAALVEDARAIGHRLMEKVEVYPGKTADLVIVDADGRPTKHHDLRAEEVTPGVVFDDPMNGFNAWMALGIVRTLYHVTGDEALGRFYYDELIRERGYLKSAADSLSVMYTGADTNYSNVNMAFVAAYGVLRYESDPGYRGGGARRAGVCAVRPRRGSRREGAPAGVLRFHLCRVPHGRRVRAWRRGARRGDGRARRDARGAHVGLRSLELRRDRDCHARLHGSGRHAPALVAGPRLERRARREGPRARAPAPAQQLRMALGPALRERRWLDEAEPGRRLSCRLERRGPGRSRSSGRRRLGGRGGRGRERRRGGRARVRVSRGERCAAHGVVGSLDRPYECDRGRAPFEASSGARWYKARVRALFFGTPAIAVPALSALASIAEVSAVVCQPDRPAGRGLALAEPPVKVRARELGIPVVQPEKIRTDEFAAWVREQVADVALVMAYGRILPPTVLEAPRRGCMNLHASLLPKYRGAAPIAWAIVRGEKETGISLMQMDEGCDTGPVYTKRAIPIGENATADDVARELAALAATVVREDLPRAVAGEIAAEPQDHAAATLAPLLKKEDGRIAWDRPAREVHDHIRGMTSWPGAFTTAFGKTLKVLESRVISEKGAAAEPGTVLVADKSGIEVACGAGVLAVVRGQLEGRRALSAPELAAGRAVTKGMKLG